MCSKTETFYNIFDKISCRVLAILHVIGNGVLILLWTSIWYGLHMSGGGVFINLYKTFPIRVSVWLTLVILCTSVHYIISVVLLSFLIISRCYGSVNIYYGVGVATSILSILITLVQVACRHGNKDTNRFLAEPAVGHTVWGLSVCGINLLLLICVYYKLPKDDRSSSISEDDKPPEIQLQETISMLPSAPPLHLLEEDVS